MTEDWDWHWNGESYVVKVNLESAVTKGVQTQFSSHVYAWLEK